MGSQHGREPTLGPAGLVEWVLAAEAERPWEQGWPSPATMFRPAEPDASWDHQPGTGLRLREANRLPADDTRRTDSGSVQGGRPGSSDR